jgi:hypothetical protein
MKNSHFFQYLRLRFPRRSKQKGGRGGRLVLMGALAASTGLNGTDLMAAPPPPTFEWAVPETPQTAPQDSPQFQFNIPAGTLGEVLAAFERIAGVTITLSNESIRTLASPGVSGSLTVEQALGQILTGTGVKHRLAAVDRVGRGGRVGVPGSLRRTAAHFIAEVSDHAARDAADRAGDHA